MSERQMGKSLSQIRPDHQARYLFASKYIKSDMNILDVMCGVGYGSRIMADKLNSHSSITSFDGSKDAIQLAKSHYSHPRINYVQREYDKFEYVEDSFDLVTCFEAIEHIEGDIGLLASINMALKEVGLLILSTPNQSFMPYSKEKFPEHLKHYTKDDLERILLSTGFKILSWHHQKTKMDIKIHPDPEGIFMICVASK